MYLFLILDTVLIKDESYDGLATGTNSMFL